MCEPAPRVGAFHRVFPRDALHALHALHALWEERGRRDEYIGTLVNAWLQGGGRAIGVRHGQSYVDVGTVHGYREALTLLADLAETCVREDGADCVILGGAAVAGLHRRIADRVSVPLLDSVATSVAMAELLARVATKPAQDRSPPPAIESVGLSDPLAATLKSPP